MKISIYKKEGADEEVVYIGDDIPTAAVKHFKCLPDEQGEYGNKYRLYSGYMINDKPMPNTYGKLEYQIGDGSLVVDEGCFDNEFLLKGNGKKMWKNKDGDVRYFFGNFSFGLL